MSSEPTPFLLRRSVVAFAEGLAGAALLLGAWGVRGGPWPAGAVGSALELACIVCTLVALPLCFIALALSCSHHGRPRIGAWALAVVVAGAYAVYMTEWIRSI